MAEEVARKPVHVESKQIAKVSPAMHGHLALEFVDGSKTVIHRGDHEVHMLSVGDYYPPLAPVEDVAPESPVEPSAQDLDAVAAEQEAAEATAEPSVEDGR